VGSSGVTGHSMHRGPEGHLQPAAACNVPVLTYERLSSICNFMCKASAPAHRYDSSIDGSIGGARVFSVLQSLAHHV